MEDTMKGRTATALLVGLFIAFIPLFLYPAEVDFVKGTVTYSHLQGNWKTVKVGMELIPGDMIKTGPSSEVSLTDEGMEIRVLENSTFTISEKYENEAQKQSFMLFLGRMKFKLGSGAKGEPEVQTQAVNLTIRGTDFEVGSGYDGSTIVLLNQGRVAVAGPSQELVLDPGEGTEVPFGEEPVEKFQVMTKVIDWKDWFVLSKESVRGNEEDLLSRILLRFEDVKTRISGLEELRAVSLKEKEEYIRQRDELQKAGRRDEAVEYSRLAAGKSRIAFHSVVNIRFLALSSIGLFDLAENIYSSVKEPTPELADTFTSVRSIYEEIEGKYILEGDRERLEKKQRKKKK
jgi:hypothetical protein